MVDKKTNTCQVQLNVTPDMAVRTDPTVIGVTAKNATFRCCLNALDLSTRKKYAAILKNIILKDNSNPDMNKFVINN
jgi:hypothetical protein